MRSVYVVALLFFFSCSANKKYQSFVGKNKEYLLLHKGQPSAIKPDGKGGEILIYWMRKKYHHQNFDDIAVLHSFYIDSKEKIYNYSSSVERTPAASSKYIIVKIPKDSSERHTRN